MNTKKPDIILSVITVVYNNHRTINRALQSVARIKCPGIEYIVVDGASNDGTSQEVSKYTTSLVDFFLSEKDKGLYDAMNKAVKLASGHFIHFLNSDDEFIISSGENLVSFLNYLKLIDTSLVLASIFYNFKGVDFIKCHSPNFLIKKYSRNPFLHPGIIASKALLLDHPFDLKYKIASDYDLFLKLFHKNISYAIIQNMFLVRMYAGGISSDESVNLKLRSAKEVFLIQSKYVPVSAFFVFCKCVLNILYKKLK